MNSIFFTGALPWLGDVVLQSTIVLGVALVASAASWRLSAAKRHTLLCLGLAGIPVLMSGSLLVPGWRCLPARADDPPVQTSWKTSVQWPSSQMAMPAPAKTAGVSKRTEAAGVRFVAWLVPLWGLGLGIGFASLLMSGRHLRRLRQSSVTITDARIVHLCLALQREAKLEPGSITLLFSRHPVMPMTWGWRHPVVLLPAEAGGWTDARLRLVLQHEIAHVARGDALSALCCALSVRLLWFHPLAWLALRRIAQLRETACDDHVLGTGQEARATYAGELLQTIAALRGSPRLRSFAPALAVGMASSAARQLKARLAAILDEHADRSVYSSRRRWTVTFVAAMGVVILSGLSACREQPASSAAGHAGSDGSRLYFLTDDQWQQLTRGADDKDLVKAAAVIRTHLVEQGVVFAPNAQGEALVLKDARAMSIWADDTNHGKVAKILAENTSGKAIHIVSRVFEVAMNSAAIDGLLAAARPSETGMLQGILSPRQGEDLLKKLAETKGVELCSQPSVTTRSGQRAMVEIVREFLYPTQFNPPQIPKAVLDAYTGKSPPESLAVTGGFPVTPTTPTAFEMKPIGFRMEIDPRFNEDGAIALAGTPEVTSFEGWINYGSPIKTASKDITGKPVEIVLTNNRVPQPVFNTIKYGFNVVLHDGDFVLIGGAGNFEPTISSGGKPGIKTEGVMLRNTGKDVDFSKLPDWKKARSATFFLINVSIVEPSVKAGAK